MHHLPNVRLYTAVGWHDVTRMCWIHTIVCYATPHMSVCVLRWDDEHGSTCVHTCVRARVCVCVHSQLEHRMRRRGHVITIHICVFCIWQSAVWKYQPRKRMRACGGVSGPFGIHWDGLLWKSSLQIDVKRHFIHTQPSDNATIQQT